MRISIYRIIFPLLFLLVYSGLVFSQGQEDSVFPGWENIPRAHLYDSTANKVSSLRNKDPYLAIQIGTYVLAKDENFKDKERARLLDELGVCYRKVGLYDNALKYHFMALEVYDTTGNLVGQSFSTSNIGNVYRALKEYKPALKFYQRSLAIKEKLKDTVQICYTLNNMGLALAGIGSLDRAEKMLLRARDLEIKTGNTRNLPNIYSNLADVEKKHGNLDKAIKLYNSAYKVYADRGNEFGVGVVSSSLADLYLDRGKFKWADKYIAKIKSLNSRIDSKVLLLSFYKLNIKHERLAGRYKSALNYYEKLSVLKDSLFKVDNTHLVRSYDAKYRIEKIAHENKLLKQNAKISSLENKEKRYLLYFLFAAVLISLGFTLLLFWRNKLIHSINRNLSAKEKELLNLNDELKNINRVKDRFYSIVAHDLKNPFQFLIGGTQFLEDDFDKLSDEEKLRMIRDIGKVSGETSDLLNNLLEWTLLQDGKLKAQKEKFDLSEIVKQTISFMERPAGQKGISLAFENKDENFVFADEEMVRTVYRNLLQNAVKFSFPDSKICTRIKKEENKVVLSVTDSGIGMDPETKSMLFTLGKTATRRGTSMEKGSGLGLVLCNELINENGGRLYFENRAEGGTTFFVELDSES